MKTQFFIALAISALSINPAFAAEKESTFERVNRTGVLRCGYITWQPFVMKDPNSGKLSGLSYDVYEAIGKNLGLKVEWVTEVLVGQQAETLNSGKIDAVCGDWPLNSVSAKFVDYMQGFAYMPIYLYQKKGGKKFTSLEQVNNTDVSISAMDGDISLLIADKKFPKAKKVQVPSFADPTQINLSVATGKADLASNDPFSIGYFNAANENVLVPVLNDKPLVTLKTSGSVKKGETDLRQLLNEGIELLITSGEVGEILDKYDPEHKMMKRPAQPWKE